MFLGRLASLSSPDLGFEAQTKKPAFWTVLRPKLPNPDEVACPAFRRAPLDLADADSTISTCLRSIMPGVDHSWLLPASSGPSAASLLELALHHPWSIGMTLLLRPSPRAVDRH